MKLRWLLPILLLAFVMPSMASSKKKAPPVTVRFFSEANARDGDSFSTPAKLQYPPRDAFISRIPEFTEREIVGIWPFTGPDGTMGCAFKLDATGRLRLSVVSTERRGSSLVAVVNNRQVIDMMIDKPVNDGVITIQQGLTPEEIELLTMKYPVIGQTPPKKKRLF